MKRNRKLNHCLNCGEDFQNNENYCPTCGQENKDKRVSLGLFISDFISNYLNFDTTFFKTIPVFLFKPGKLTNEYNEGRRRKYIQPIRLYLIFSLFYFFIFGWVIPKNFLDDVMNGSLANLIEKDSLKENPQLKDVDPEDRAVLDSLFSSYGQVNQKLSTSDTTTRTYGWKELKILAIDPEVDNDQFNAALQNSSFTIINRISIGKKRAFIANSSLFISGVARNLPLMMFVLLPFFALILKLLYFRHEKYYVEHLIHGLNLHSFAYFIYGLTILWVVYIEWKAGSIIFGGFLLVTVYAYFSLKRVYNQGWFKTFFKFTLLGSVYFNLLILGLLGESYITLLLM